MPEEEKNIKLSINMLNEFLDCPFCEDEIVFGRNIFDPEDIPEFVWHPAKLF
ncbi:MAG: hypothetical protein QXF15_00975 [Candidatus Aenigmatarchaeota archaeon]|nr:hypothetical protein [Candidatus Aenigmarchaeota archaeon]